MFEVAWFIGWMAVGGYVLFRERRRVERRKREREMHTIEDCIPDFHKSELAEWDAQFFKETGKQVSPEGTFAWSPQKQHTIAGSFQQILRPGFGGLFNQPHDDQEMLRAMQNQQSPMLEQQLQNQLWAQHQQKIIRKNDILHQLLGGLGRGIWPN